MDSTLKFGSFFVSYIRNNSGLLFSFHDDTLTFYNIPMISRFVIKYSTVCGFLTISLQSHLIQFH